MLQVDYDTYKAISTQVHYVFQQFSDTVERYSMDEYFMDISFLVGKPESKIRAFAQSIQDKIFEATNLYGSIGVARSKTYAKLSSSLDKPKGITSIITGEDERAFIYPLDVDEVWGVGGRRYEHILAEGFRTIGDVVDRGTDKTFMRLFGANFGKMLYQTITGQDQARVLDENDNYIPKWGVSYGHTFSEGSCDVERIKGEFAIAVEHVCYRLRAYGIKANSFTGMFGFNSTDQPGVGFKFGIDGYTNIDKVVFESCMSRILPAIEGASRANMEIRNIIIGTKEIDKTEQLNLFFSEEARELERFKAIDQINNRYGKGTLTKAHTLLRVQGNTHFLERSV
jgi:DNA polymerase-4